MHVKRRRLATCGHADEARLLLICVGMHATRFTFFISKAHLVQRSGDRLLGMRQRLASHRSTDIQQQHHAACKRLSAPTRTSPTPTQGCGCALTSTATYRVKSQHMHRAGMHLRRGGARRSDRQAEVTPLIVSRKARIRSLHSKATPEPGQGADQTAPEEPPKSHWRVHGATNRKASED
jgi:hypothetical protein